MSLLDGRLFSYDLLIGQCKWLNDFVQQCPNAEARIALPACSHLGLGHNELLRLFDLLSVDLFTALLLCEGIGDSRQLRYPLCDICNIMFPTPLSE